MDDQHFRMLLDFLGHSWEGYRKVRKGVKKRVAQYMREQGSRSMSSFLGFLEKNPDQRERVGKLMAVPISRFFRDRKLWKTMEEEVLPAIVPKEKQKIKVWSAGCARGEEVYSFKILWQEWGRNRNRLPDLEFWATDQNEDFLEKARMGVYSSSSLKGVFEDWRLRYFLPVEENRWAISDSLKEGIHWKVHDLLVDEPPGKNFQVIFLRNNLLTYYKEEILRPAFARVVESLSPDGFLVIGGHEKLPKEFPELIPFPAHPNIFEKIPNQSQKTTTSSHQRYPALILR